MAELCLPQSQAVIPLGKIRSIQIDNIDQADWCCRPLSWKAGSNKKYQCDSIDPAQSGSQPQCPIEAEQPARPSLNVDHRLIIRRQRPTLLSHTQVNFPK